MYEVLKNEKFTDKTLWHTQVQTQHLSVLWIKMVLCQGCTWNISTFCVELFINKLLPLKWYKSSWFSVAAQVPLQEEDLPLCKEQCFLQHSLASACPLQLLLSALDSSVEYCSSHVSCRKDCFLKLLSPNCEKQDFSVSCLLGNQKLSSPPPDASYSSKTPAITVVLSISHLVCKWCHFFLSDTAIKCCSRFSPLCMR